MTRPWLLLLVMIAALAIVLFPRPEETYEFDGANYRLRACSRYCSFLLGFTIWERCSAARDHPTAVRLRELGVLPPVNEADTRWLLIKGFTWGVRGWIGPGREYLRVLGPTTFITPVPLPTAEDLSANVWVRWAEKDLSAAKHFWQLVRVLAVDQPRGDLRATDYLRVAKLLLEERKHDVSGAEVEAYAKQEADRDRVIPPLQPK